LVEFDKELTDIFFANADACIFHFDSEHLAFSPSANGDSASLGGELDRIGEVVVQHLFEFSWIEANRADQRVKFHVNSERLLVTERPENALDLRQHYIEIDFFWMKFHFADFDFRQIENVVDQLKQVTRAHQYIVQVFLVFFGYGSNHVIVHH